MKDRRPNRSQEAKELVRKLALENGGMIRTNQALKAGVHRRDFYGLIHDGELEKIDRGLYQLTTTSQPTEPDLLQAMLKVPQGILYLISALALHRLTTQIPRRVQLSIPEDAKAPRTIWPHLEIYRTSEAAYKAGIETQKIDNIAVRVYSPEKTIADCFKHRKRVGLDVCLEALQNYKKQGGKNLRDLYKYAEIDRVKTLMQPYIEAIWSIE